MQSFTAISGRLGLLVLLGFLAAGCSIKNDLPDFKFQSQADAANQDWPKLAVTADLIKAGEDTLAQVGDTTAEMDRLEARAKRLRAKAAALGVSSTN